MDIVDELKNNFVLPLWNNQDIDLIDKYIDPAANIRTTFLVGKGPEAMKASVRDTFSAFPTFELSLEDIVQQENKLTFKWSAIVEHQGAILNIPPSGKRMIFHGIVFGEVHKRLVTQYHSFSNIPQILYENLKGSHINLNEPNIESFPSHAVLLNHENYEKEISDLLFSITKLTAVRLTRREAECLNFWLRGYSIKETARQLGSLSAKTIQVHRSNIQKKFNTTSYRALFDFVQKTGILSLFLGQST